jgi:hypothetical protein
VMLYVPGKERCSARCEACGSNCFTPIAAREPDTLRYSCNGCDATYTCS